MIASAIRQRRPLVHCLTNDVTVGRVADALAALGALPVMASAEEEAAEMAAQADALVLNLGTPRADRWRAAGAAGEWARAGGTPVVLDPVGCGATAWRAVEARSLAQRVRPTIVRGNLPEVATLAGLDVTHARLRGVAVESTNCQTNPPNCQTIEEESARVATNAARQLGAVVLVTGPVDWLSDGDRTERHAADVPALVGLVGAGDVLTAVVAACAAVEPDAFAAARAGFELFATAARVASARSQGPGTFWPAWLDAVASFSADATGDHTAQMEVSP